jgi:uncharacterized membrane protein
MKILTKIENFKLSTKLIILIVTIILIAILNFIYYNYQSLKLPANERLYVIDLSDSSEEYFGKTNSGINTNSENSTITWNQENKYIRNLIINYETKSDFDITLSGEFANNYGIFNNSETSKQCYSYVNRCGFAINNKTGTLNLTINKENVIIKSITVDNSLYFNYSTYIFWTICICSIMVIFMFSNLFFKKIHLLTFMLCISFGIMLVVTEHNMTSISMDDDTHYYVASGLKTSYSDADVSFHYYSTKFYNLQTKFERNDYRKYLNNVASKKTYDYTQSNNLFSTSKICYLPFAIILRITSNIGVDFTISFLLARLANLLIYSLAVMFAVKLMPTLKIFTMLIALLPQSVFLATNFSYDPTVTAFLLLAFAAFMKEYNNKTEKIDSKNIIIFILSALYGSFPKAIYSPIILLLLLLPKEKFQNKKQYKYFRLVVVGIFILSMATFALTLLTNISTAADTRGGDTSVLRQVKLILKCPASFIKTFWYGAILNTPYKLFSPATLGRLSYYGSMDDNTCYYLLIFALIFAFISEKKYTLILKKDKFFMSIIYFFIICSIWGSMYLAFTPVGYDVINGVQNRYFIPLILPICFCFSSSKLKNSINEKNAMIICSILSIISFSLLIYDIIVKVYCL